MRSTGIIFSISALALGAMTFGAGACNSSSGTPPAQGTGADSGGQGDDGSTGSSSGGSSSGGSSSGGSSSGGSSSGGSSSGGSSSGGSSSGGSDSGIDLPPPDLSNVCPDSNPTNLTFATADSLPLDTYGQARVGAGVIQGSDDWFSFVAPKHDPANILVNYTVGAGNTSQLRLDDYVTTDNFVTNDTTTRTLSSQTLSTFFETTAQETYSVRIQSSTATCTPFDLFVKALYCTDQYEDNDDTTQCATIPLTSTAYTAPTTWATDNANISATIDGLDDDWYTITAPLSDPMSTSVTYTRPAGDTVTLRLDIYDNLANFVTNDTTARSMATQTLNTIWEGTAGTAYRIRVQSNTDDVCADYTAAFVGLWCTDNYEDDDTFATAKALPATATPATITSGDDDWYILTGPGANGSCNVTYTVPAGSTQQLRVDVYDVGNNFINNDTTTRSSSTQTLSATWTSSDAPYAVRVQASALECTSYTITCH
jgi:hypothetical protein